jgi:uncharacterized protein (TIGR00296 family)
LFKSVLLFVLNAEHGEYLVKLARTVIESELGLVERPRTADAPSVTKAKCGVFVTLNTVRDEGETLRGCIGYPYPIKDLLTAVMDSAHNAAFGDPRFPPVERDEMDHIKVEVSVLTPPLIVKVSNPIEYPSKVKVGRDGLILSRGMRRGLLLPQVAVDWGWDAEEFLSQCCFKAGLPPDSWLLEGTEVQVFQAIIYVERSPRGEVVRHEIS